MAIYFNDFPNIAYDAFRTGNLINTVNITKRFKPLDAILDRITLYYPYNIKEGERPDIVSYKWYNTVDYDWLILMVNSKFDPYYEWPLNNDEFQAYLEDKYGSVQTAYQTVYQYQKIIVPQATLSDGTNIDQQTLVVDYDYYLTLDANQRTIVYAYDYEQQLNEDRRNIQILDPVYIPEIDREKVKIFD